MATRTINVTTRATLAAGSNPNGYGDDVTITNTGTATAYLDSDQPDSTTSGQPLSAGSSLTWAKDQPLWTVAPVATTLVVSENTGAIFDAGAIASQILAQGLAAQIAAAINVVGVPAIESATVLMNFSVVTPAFANPGFGGIVDCSRYQSLRAYFSETYAIGVILPPRPITVTWYADAAGTIPIGFDAFNVPTGTNAGLVPVASALVAVPCRGPFFELSAQAIGGDSTAGVVVVGSYRPVQDLKWSKLTDGFTGSSGVVVNTATGASGGTFSMSANFPVGTSTDYPILSGGDAAVSLTIGATTGNCSFEIRDTYSGRYVWRRLTLTSANSQSFVDKFVLPNSPVSAAVVIAGGVTNVNFSIVSVDKA